MYRASQFVVLCFCWLLAFVPSIRGNEIPLSPSAEELTPFAENVLFHVVLHELGHGVVREFDLPILGNEETLADAFATYFVIRHFPDRAFDVVKARTESLLIESNEVPRVEWTVKGEHNNDARRAFQIMALAVAADREKFEQLAKEIGMTDREIARAVDYGSEIHRSWRRLLRPIMMPTGMESREVGMRFDASCEMASQIRSSRLATDIEKALRMIDWHSTVSVNFAEGDGGAAWSRSSRSVTVHSEYVRRFIEQGRRSSAE